MPEFELEVDDELAEEVRRLAAKLGISAEEFVRRAIRIYLAEGTPGQEDPRSR